GSEQTTHLNVLRLQPEPVDVTSASPSLCPCTQLNKVHIITQHHFCINNQSGSNRSTLLQKSPDAARHRRNQEQDVLLAQNAFEKKELQQHEFLPRHQSLRSQGKYILIK
ncbi:Hypothetical predicted protein, partial [Podarcis lilfordi]